MPASEVRRRGFPAMAADLGEHLARDLESLDGDSRRSANVRRRAGGDPFARARKLAGARRLEKREPGFAQTTGVGQRVGTRDQKTRAGPRRRARRATSAIASHSAARSNASASAARMAASSAQRRCPLVLTTTGPMVRESLGWCTGCFERGREHEMERSALAARQSAGDGFVYAVVIRLDDLHHPRGSGARRAARRSHRPPLLDRAPTRATAIERGNTPPSTTIT